MDVREHVHSHASSCSQVSAESFFSLVPSGDFTKPFGMPRYLREQSLLHYATSHVWTHEWRNRVTSWVGGGCHHSQYSHVSAFSVRPGFE